MVISSFTLRARLNALRAFFVSFTVTVESPAAIAWVSVPTVTALLALGLIFNLRAVFLSTLIVTTSVPASLLVDVSLMPLVRALFSDCFGVVRRRTPVS